MKVIVDKKGNAYTSDDPKISDWGLLILCVINLVIAVMLVARQTKLELYQQETRERVDVIYKVITVER